MLSSPSTQDVYEKATQAQRRLRVALQDVKTTYLSQQHKDGTPTKAYEASSMRPAPSGNHEEEMEGARIIKMEWPLSSLTQRAKERKSRDAQRQRRRAARQTTVAATTAASSMSAADVMRHTLTQPLGVMAARLLSAATAGAPSLFSDLSVSGHEEAVPPTATTASTTRGASPPPPLHLAGPGSKTAGPAGAATHTPSPSVSLHTCDQQSASMRADLRRRQCLYHHNHRHHHHHHRNGNLRSSPLMRSCAYCDSVDAHLRRPHLALSATPRSPLQDKGTTEMEWRQAAQQRKDTTASNNKDSSSSKMSLRADALSSSGYHARRPHHHRHRRHKLHCPHAPLVSKTIEVSATAAKGEASLSTPSPTRSTPISALSSTRTFFGNSPISILARTFGGGSGGAGFGNSPTMDGVCAQRRTELSALTWTPDAVGVVGGVAGGRSDAPLPRSYSEVSSCSSFCSCSCSCSSSADEWCSSSWTPSDTVASTGAAADAFFYPLVAPGPDGTYNPHAPLPSLLRCYGDAETRDFFKAASSSSASAACSESRSSTPFSSEWSAETSSVHGNSTVTATPPGAPGGKPEKKSDSLSETSDGAGSRAGHSPTAHHLSSRDSSARRWRGSRKGPPHRRHSSVLSPSMPTQLSFATEIEAIEKGKVAPYMSYLFAPEARVVDLGQLEGQLRQRALSPSVSATCVRFNHAGDAYLVGTSSGLLWRVPVGSGQEAVRATPLGSLWPPPSQIPAHDVRGRGGGGAAADAGAPFSATSVTSVGTAGDVKMDGLSPPPSGTHAPPAALQLSPLSLLPSQPAPLSGHTAAILSIAFNDDGSLYATTGLDGCVIVWKASTSAKLRRISAVWANASAQRAPHLVRFMPQNNNYLLVSYVDSGELHLYNSSTGLPVTNVVGTGLTRLTVSGSGGVGGVIGAGSKSISRSGSKQSGEGSSAITALAVDQLASPFFVSGDASGMVVLWTYRAGDLVTWPTLRATSPPAGSSGSGAARHLRSRSSVMDSPCYSVSSGCDDTTPSLGGSGGGSIFSTPLYQLPELRRVAACALPAQAGGVAELSVSTLHASQLHSLFRPRGSQHEHHPTATDQGNPEGTASHGRLRHPLENTAQILHAAAVQNRACSEELGARQAEEEAATTTGGGAAIHNRREGGTNSGNSTPTTNHAHGSASSGGSSFPHILAGLPSRLSDTLSALWGSSGGGSGSGSGGNSHRERLPSSAVASARRTDTASLSSPHPSAASASKGSHSAAAAAGSSSTADFNTAAMTEKELLKHLRTDAMDVVCPLLILVTAPCDTVYSLGVLLQLQHGTSHPSSSGGGGSGPHSSHGNARGSAAAAATPTVSYRIFPLLKTTGPSRMRHVGVGAVPSPDNHRLVVVAAPCEEGFVRVLPLLRLEAATAAATTTSTTATASTGKTGMTEAARANKKHVLATLPMPHGGRCTGIAWSPSGRFLVAITTEGVIYEWSRVYLLNTNITSTSSNSGVLRAPLLKSNLAGPTKATQRTAGGAGDGMGPVRAASHGDAPLAVAEQNAHQAPADAGGMGNTVSGAVAARRRGCGTEYSDTVHQPASTLHFTSLLGTSIAAPAAVAAAAAAMARESDAARAAFSEGDAWRSSFQRELERQRREQAALKLVTQLGDGDGDDVNSSGYWLDEDASSKGSLDTFDEEDETGLEGSSSTA
jgi:WD40 repeat protein